MFCRQCGAEIRDGSQFCPKCGAQLARDEAKRGKSAVKIATAKKPPLKLIGLLVAGIAVVALIVFVAVPLAGKLLGKGDTSTSPEHSEALSTGGEVEAAGNGGETTEGGSEAAGAGAGSEGIVLQPSKNDGFDYSKIEIGEIRRTDYPESTSTSAPKSIFEWTVSNTSDVPCPVVALDVSFDYSAYSNGGYRDGEIKTARVSLRDESSQTIWDIWHGGPFDWVGGIQGVGVAARRTINIDGDINYTIYDGDTKDPYVFVCELKPGETRNISFYPNTYDDLWADEEKTVYSYDNVAVEVNASESDVAAKHFEGKNAQRVLPEEWDVTEPKVTAEGDEDRLSFSFTNTTDYRVKNAYIYYAPVGSDGHLWFASTTNVRLLEPGETVTIECATPRKLDAITSATSYQVLLVDAVFE